MTWLWVAAGVALIAFACEIRHEYLVEQRWREERERFQAELDARLNGNSRRAAVVPLPRRREHQ